MNIAYYDVSAIPVGSFHVACFGLPHDSNVMKGIPGISEELIDLIQGQYLKQITGAVFNNW